jgi:uncharacterized protein YbjT (DUF2867 family)
MKLLLLGANGRTGREILRLGLDQGDNISALVRHKDRLADVKHDRLDVLAGNACDPQLLKTIAPGHDAVISVLGPRSPSRQASAIYSDAASALVEALPKSGVRRLLVMSTALLFPHSGFTSAALRTLVAGMVGQARLMETRIMSSSLDWTIVRTGFLKDGPDDGVSLAVGVPAKGRAVSRAAVARTLLSEALKPEHSGAILGVSGPVRGSVS